jgi:hypothetical protein
MNGTMGFLLAVGGVSTIIYWLMNRAENRAARRSSTGDGSGSSYLSTSDSVGGWSLWNLTNSFSTGNSSSESCGTSGASGGWDSGGSDSGGGGGGDSGGGGDGGGGGD